MNSVANGKIKLNTPFKQVYVQSAAGNAGGAIGAAMVVWHQLNRGSSGFLPPPQPSATAPCVALPPPSMESSPSEGERVKRSRDFVMDHAFWGPSYTADEIKVVLDDQGDALESAGCTVESLADAELFKQTAATIAEG